MDGHAFGPVWSPDGTEIAFWAWQANRDQLYVASAAGGTPQQLTDFQGGGSEPTWAPDGRTIAFESKGPEGDESLHIWTVSRDSAGLPWGDPVRLTDFPCRYPDWAPDGSRFVCDGWPEMDIVTASRTGEVLDRHPMQIGFTRLRYSPDGSRIYFWCYFPDGSVGICWIPSGEGDVTKVVALDDPTKEIAGLLTGIQALTVGPENLYVTISEYDSDIWVADLDW